MGDTAGDSFITLWNVGVGNPGGSKCYYSASIVSSSTNTVTYSTDSAAGVIIQAIEFQGLTLDQIASSATSAAASLSVPASYQNEMGFGAAANGSSGISTCPPASWLVFRNNSYSCDGYKLVAGQSSIVMNAGVVTGTNIGLADFEISASPVFVAGWYVIFENQTGHLVTVTPTTSTINGQTTLVLVPNQSCAVMSDGANYDAFCSVQPNVTTNGVMGQAVEVAGVNATTQTSDITTTTLFTTGAVNASYMVAANVSCVTSVSTAVAPLVITYTDTSSTTETYTGSATCTTLGTNSTASIMQSFRAASGTIISYSVVHTGSQPHYDVSIALYQLSTK